MHFHHVHPLPTIPPRYTLFPTHPTHFFKKNKAIKSNLCCSQTLGYAAFFSRMWSTPSEIGGCSSYQLPTAPQLWVRLHARLSPPRLDLLASASAGLRVLSPLCEFSSVQKHLPFDHSLHWVLMPFPPHLSRCSLNLDRDSAV